MASSGKLTKSAGFESTGKDVRNLVRLVLDCLGTAVATIFYFLRLFIIGFNLVCQFVI